MVLLVLGLVGLAPAAVAEPVPTATTTAVALSSPRGLVLAVTVTVRSQDGTAPTGEAHILARSADGTYQGDFGRWRLSGGTVTVNLRLPRADTYEVETRFEPSSTSYAASVATGSAVVAGEDPPELELGGGDHGNGTLRLIARLLTLDGRVTDGSFVFRLPGRPAVTSAIRDGEGTAEFRGLPGGRHTVTVTYLPAAGSDLEEVTGRVTTRLSATRHPTVLSAAATSPRRGTVRLVVGLSAPSPAGLTGTVVVRDLRTKKVVARVASMRSTTGRPGVVRTFSGVTRGRHSYALVFTPSESFSTTASGDDAKVTVVVR